MDAKTVGGCLDWLREYDAKHAQVDAAMTVLRRITERALAAAKVPDTAELHRLEVEGRAASEVVRRLLDEERAILSFHRENL